MVSFVDHKGTQWKMNLTFGMIQKVKDDTGVNFDDMINDPKKFGELLLTQPQKLIELIWVICEEQAQSAGISPKDFGFLFDRGTLDAATNAVMEALIDFYPRSSVGKAIREKLPRLIQEADELTTIETRRILDKGLNGILSGKDGNSPESSGVSPTYPA